MTETCCGMTAEQAGERSKEMHAAGFNCAEATYQALVEGLSIDAPLTLRCTSGLAGGMGGTHRFTCGIINGAAVVAGILLGRDEPTATPPEAYTMIGELIADFEKEYGTVLCYELIDVDPALSYEEFHAETKAKQTRVNVCDGLKVFTIRRFYELLPKYRASVS